jgi:hypothetical protein
MKKLLFAMLLFIGCNQKNWYPETDNETSMIVYTMATHIPLEDFYRKLTGYDSLQLIIRNGGKLGANFCFPNQWEFEKWRKDTVYIHDTVVKIVYINQPNIKSVNQTGGQTAETIINNE